jgi:prolyl-tRNA editing enzyme YbaK/EbsC (Cys-tRNA(Pro) deacylase)
VSAAGTLDLVAVSDRPDLLAEPVATALGSWKRAAEVSVAEIDPSLADTAALVEAHSVPLEMSANCVVVAGRRGGDERIAACVVLATTRADVNGLVRRLLDVRKASFLAMDLAVEWTGMEYGGITPVGLPESWSVFVDSAVAATPYVVIGSGVRRSKLALPGAALADLPGAQVIDGLGQLV